MSPPPLSDRRCRSCHNRRGDHEFTELRCPDGSGRTYSVTVKAPNAASNSFSDDQLRALVTVLDKMRTDPNYRVVMRSPDLIAAERKLRAMRTTIQQRLGAVAAAASTSNGGDHG